MAKGKKRKGFPGVVYGRDIRHGRSGPEYDSPGDGFAENRGYEGSGYELQYFRGMYLDRLSIIEILDREAGERSALEDAMDQEFLSSLGFTNDGTTLIN